MAIDTPATLLERERELVALGDALTGAHESRGGVVLVEAPAGLGKTSLLRAAGDTAVEAGFACLRARATELERDFAYGCVRQLLEPAVAKASGPVRERLFAGAAGLSKPLLDPAGAPLPPVSADTSFSMLHGLFWTLSNLSEDAPVVLLVDDLHWADTESLRLLGYLAPRLEGLRLAVVASSRSGDNLTPDLVRLAAGPETTVLRPQPLSTEATATLLERRLGAVAPEFAAACREATGGNPFFLDALVREVGRQDIATDAREAADVRHIGPAAVAQAVLLRLSGRPAGATALVRAVAVLGDGASLAEAAGLAELDDEQAAGAADVITSLAILRPSERLEFAHPIVREAVYSDIGAHERGLAHARAARILTAGGASGERIAAQLVEAEPQGDAARVELLRRVAADALARGAPAAAVAWLRRAVVEPPPPEAKGEVLLELGSAEVRLAAPEAAGHLSAALELLREPQQLALAVRLFANALTMNGDADHAVRAIESVIPVVEPEDRELALSLEAELAAKAQQAGLEARASAARRLECYSGVPGDTPGERLVLACLAFERARASESAADAAGHIERALGGGRWLEEQQLDVVGPFYVLVFGLLATDELELAHACLEQALADAQTRGSIPALAFVVAHRGWASLRLGSVTQAEADARTALELLTAHDIWQGSAFALALLIEALIETGDTDAAEQALLESGFGADIPAGLASNDLLKARGLLNVTQGRMQQGVDDLLEFGRRDELWGGANPLASRWRSRAAPALALLGDGERACALAAEDLERAQRWGAASGVGVALRALALVEGGAEAIDRLREAAASSGRSPARLEHARALIDLGAALRRANRRGQARGALEEGLALAERGGADALAGRARTELRAAGGRSSDPQGSGIEQLTASERRVAELAAEGRSNPEIAQVLFVTRKTVETHLGRVYSKLEISGRGELPRELAQG